MDALKKSASNGHVPAVQSLESLVRRGKLSFQEIYPTIDLLITLEHADRIDVDDWITTPHAANLISCFGMLAVYFSGQKPDKLTNFNIDTLPELWFYIQEWSLLFMERTRILDVDAIPRDLELVELIERVLIAVSPLIPQYLPFISVDHPRTTKFFQRLVRFWIRCSACPNVLAPNIMDFIATAAYPDQTMDHREALKNTISFLPPNEVVSTLVSSYAKLITEEPVLNVDHAKILVMFTSFAFGHDHSAYELRTSHISYWSARLFRRITSLRAHQDVGQPRTRLMVVAWETLDNLDTLSVLGYMWVKDVLRADLLHALLNIQVLVHRSGDTELRQAALDVKIARMLVRIRPFLIWPSIRALVRKSLRCIRSSGILEGLDLTKAQATRGFLVLQDVTTTLSEGYTLKKKMLSSCANPECCDPRQIRFQRCLGCRPSYCVYCSYSCQKEHWKNGHDEYEHSLLSLSYSRPTIVRFHLGSTCDEEWLQYQAYCDLSVHREAIAALSTQGKDIPVLVMDYRSFVQKRKADLSMFSCNDLSNSFPSILYESWYETMKPHRLVNDRIVIILGPFTPEIPYSRATTVNWLNNLNYPTLNTYE